MMYIEVQQQQDEEAMYIKRVYIGAKHPQDVHLENILTFTTRCTTS